MSGDERGALSILAAGTQAGDAPGLRLGDREWTYAQLARLARERIAELEPLWVDRTRPFAVIGTNTLQTVVTLYALLERRVPALLIHPRLTEPERAALLARAAAAGPLPGDDACAVLFTSGTTGAPKGAVLSRSAMLTSARASEVNLGWQDDDCWLLCMPIAHVGGLSILTRCLAARKCVSLAQGFDVAGFPALADAHRVSIASLVPTMLAKVMDEHPAWAGSGALRAILLGGAAASPKLLARARERGLPVFTSYGLTESCAQICATGMDERFAPAGLGAGRPLPGVSVRIVDGRIQVAGPTMMAGYWGEPALVPGAWFDTGDLGEVDFAGRLHVYARRTDLIVTGGENVYPLEVEQALEQAPGIAAAAVFGVDDETWGQTVAAALVSDGTPPDDAELARWIALHLARHKRPRGVCWLAQLPQTPGGKPDRAALNALAGQLRALKYEAQA